MLSEIIDCKGEENAADLGHWKWLKKVITTLGQDGMSSEESDNDGAIGTIYRPKRMVWRRDIDRELKLIDDECRRLASAKARRGAKLAPRERRIGGVVSTRDPVTHLPIPFYNEAWIAGKTDRWVKHTLKASATPFVWRELFIQ